MQVRYQAALRPDRRAIITAYERLPLAAQHRNDTPEFTLHLANIESGFDLRYFQMSRLRFIQTIARPVDGKPMFV